MLRCVEEFCSGVVKQVGRKGWVLRLAMSTKIGVVGPMY